MKKRVKLKLIHAQWVSSLKKENEKFRYFWIKKILQREKKIHWIHYLHQIIESRRRR